MPRPTGKQLQGAVEELAAIPFFPTGESARVAIATQIGKFVAEAHQLRWLVDAAINVMRKWDGIPELRGLYCTRFKPLDGVEGFCSLPGYRPEDCEALASSKRDYGAFLESPVKRDAELEAAITALTVTKKIQ